MRVGWVLLLSGCGLFEPAPPPSCVTWTSTPKVVSTPDARDVADIGVVALPGDALGAWWRLGSASEIQAVQLDHALSWAAEPQTMHAPTTVAIDGDYEATGTRFVVARTDGDALPAAIDVLEGRATGVPSVMAPAEDPRPALEVTVARMGTHPVYAWSSAEPHPPFTLFAGDRDDVVTSDGPADAVRRAPTLLRTATGLDVAWVTGDGALRRAPLDPDTRVMGEIATVVETGVVDALAVPQADGTDRIAWRTADALHLANGDGSTTIAPPGADRLALGGDGGATIVAASVPGPDGDLDVQLTVVGPDGSTCPIATPRSGTLLDEALPALAVWSGATGLEGAVLWRGLAGTRDVVWARTFAATPPPVSP